MKSKTVVESPRCTSQCDGDKCEKPAGHHGKHLSTQDSEGNPQWCAWTDAGAERSAREAREKELEQFFDAIGVNQ